MKAFVSGRGYGLIRRGQVVIRGTEASFINELAPLVGELSFVTMVAHGSSDLVRTLRDFDGYLESRVKATPIGSGLHVPPAPRDRVAVIRIGMRILWREAGCADAVIALMPSPISFMALIVARLRGVPSVAYLGGDWGARLTPLGADSVQTGRVDPTRTLRAALQWASSILATRVLTRDPGLVPARLRTSGKVAFARPAISVPRGDYFVRDDTCRDAEIRLLTVGSLRPIKGISDMLSALSLLQGDDRAFNWSHVGMAPPDFRAAMMQRVGELGLAGRVRFHGVVTHRRVLELYREHDILVIPSLAEGFPRVLSEAFSQSLPVVVTAVGGIPERLTHLQQAVLVPPARPALLASGIRRVASDSAMRRRLIRGGREWALRESRQGSLATQLATTLKGLTHAAT